MWSHVAQRWTAYFNDDDPFAPHRSVIIYRISGVTASVLAPVGVWHWWQGRAQMALFVSLAVMALLLCVKSLRQNRESPLPYPIIMLLLTVAVVGSIVNYGLPALLWAYPTLIVCHFVLTRAMALWVSLSLIVAVTAAAAWTLTALIAMRAAATMLLSWVMINIIVHAMADLQRALQRQAVTDPLTGAYNRRHFDTLLKDLAERPMRPVRREGRHALLAIDIDHFKQINDRHGHASGDEVLRAMVQLLRQQTREADTVCRTGGEEFIVLLPDTDADEAQRVAERVRASVAAATWPHGEPVTASLGVSVHLPGQTGEAWLNRGDHALYCAKHAGRNRVVVA